MSYLTFLMVFLVPPILGLVLANTWKRKSIPGFVLSVIFICVIAFTYTTPWDNLLVSKEIWGYPPDRVLGKWGFVPYEEYAFFILQPIMTAAWLLWILRPSVIEETVAQPYSEEDRASRFLGAAATVMVTYLGAAFLTISWGTYLGLILVWAGPVIAFQWIYGGHHLWRMRKLWFLGWFPPTLYLWIADRIAIAEGIWFFSDYQTSGFTLLGLPVEEALFFVVTNLMVVQGLLLYQTTLYQLRKQEHPRLDRLLGFFKKRLNAHG